MPALAAPGAQFGPLLTVLTTCCCRSRSPRWSRLCSPQPSLGASIVPLTAVPLRSRFAHQKQIQLTLRSAAHTSSTRRSVAAGSVCVCCQLSVRVLQVDFSTEVEFESSDIQFEAFEDYEVGDYDVCQLMIQSDQNKEGCDDIKAELQVCV